MNDIEQVMRLASPGIAVRYIWKWDFDMKRIFDLFLFLLLDYGLGGSNFYHCRFSQADFQWSCVILVRSGGMGNKIFKMPKFRTMRIDTPAVATHLLKDPTHI